MKCHVCGKDIASANSKFCKYCGAAVKQPISEEAIIPNNQEQNRCQGCGSLIKSGNRFCTNCGRLIATGFSDKSLNAAELQKGKSRDKKRKAVIIVLLLSFLLALALLVIAGLFYLKSRYPETDKPVNDNEFSAENRVSPDAKVSVGIMDTENNAFEENAFSNDIQESENTTEFLNSEVQGTETSVEESDVVYDSAEGGVHRYEYIINDCTWTQAFELAKKTGGYLAHINSPEEFACIIGEIEARNYMGIHFFIGGRREVTDTNYYWVDENNFPYGEVINGSNYWAISSWLPGEPSYVDGDILENCIDIYYSDVEEKWIFNDVPDDILAAVPYFNGKIGYIVEYE